MKKESSYPLRMTLDQRQQLDQMFQASGKKSLNEFLLDRLFNTRSDQDQVLAELAQLKGMISNLQADITKKPDTARGTAKDDMISQNKKRLTALWGFDALPRKKKMHHLTAVETIDQDEYLLELLGRAQSDINSMLATAPVSNNSDIGWLPRPVEHIAADRGITEKEVKTAARSGSDWVQFKDGRYWLATKVT